MTTLTCLRRALLASALLAATGGVAAADAHGALVLKADGGADAATRGRVDALVLRLAKQGGLAATAADISYADAAAASGCEPSVPSCRDEVMATLSVDELVTATTYVSGGELKVIVRRGGKGAPAREATATAAMIDSSDASLEAGLAPLFGVTPAPVAAIAPRPTQPGPELSATPPPQPAPDAPAPPVTAASDGQVTDPNAPAAPSDSIFPRHKVEVAGAVVGGVALVLSFVLWGEAHSTDTQIHSAPTNTSADLQRLKSLENQGDSQANGGNFVFVTGLVVGGISGYFLYRDYKRDQAHAAQHARIVPMLVDHGAGLALTFGGTP